MKEKVGAGPQEVEVGNFRVINKNSLKATFSLCIYPEGQKILECRYFVKDNQRWFNFPQKEIKDREGNQDYIPLVSYMNKDYQEQLKESVIKLLKQSEEDYEKNPPSYAKKNSFQGEAPTNREGLPF